MNEEKDMNIPVNSEAQLKRDIARMISSALFIMVVLGILMTTALVWAQ